MACLSLVCVPSQQMLLAAVKSCHPEWGPTQIAGLTNLAADADWYVLLVFQFILALATSHIPCRSLAAQD